MTFDLLIDKKNAELSLEIAVYSNHRCSVKLHHHEQAFAEAHLGIYVLLTPVVLSWILKIHIENDNHYKCHS
ncbi:hypothetical protein D3C75_737540 [compost metagenome]